VTKSPYAKKLHIIFLNHTSIENPDRFVRHLKCLLKNEKVVTGTDKSLQRIETMIKGLNRIIVLGEFPSMIEKETPQVDLVRIRETMDILSGMSK
jgi:hypothetical protein